MDILKGLKTETKETLAELWEDKKFQELVKILRVNQDNYAKLCLTRPNWEEIQKLQWQAYTISLIIKTVEEAYRKVNKIKEK